MIEIDLEVLNENDFLLADGNAASKSTRFFKKLSDLREMPWDVLRSSSWFDKKDGKRKRCAEVLIYPKVDHKFIKALHFRDTLPKLDDINKRQCITPKLYFD